MADDPRAYQVAAARSWNGNGNGHGDAAPPPERPRWGGGQRANPVKDRTITRLACLKAAAEFAASKPEAKSADVLKIAAAWEQWVTR